MQANAFSGIAPQQTTMVAWATESDKTKKFEFKKMNEIERFPPNMAIGQLRDNLVISGGYLQEKKTFIWNFAQNSVKRLPEMQFPHNGHVILIYKEKTLFAIGGGN